MSSTNSIMVEKNSKDKTKYPEVIDNRYQVIETLGKGAMGVVYLVEDRLVNNQRLALKQIDSSILNHDTLKIFKQEFEVMSRLKHPNLIRVFDLGYDHKYGVYYLTMEYINGRPLSDILTSQENFTSQQAIAVIIDLCRALSFIHSRNIVHRDIKPSNIMVMPDQTVKLTDFGLADIGTGEKKIKGTINYMAPEVLEKACTPQTDIFALGITAYEMLTNKMFFPDLTSKHVCTILKDEILYKQHSNLNCNQLIKLNLNNIIAKMTTYNPLQRYRTCSEIIQDINYFTSTNYCLETEETREAYVLGAFFVGREKELEKLKGRLDKTNKCSKAIWVQGEAGVGKSRLFYEFKTWCLVNDISFFEGTCSEQVQNLFGPFLPIISKLLLSASSEYLAKHGPDLKKILPHHNSLKPIAANPVYDPKTEHDLMVRTMVESLIDMTNSYTNECVFFLNDMHWSDEGSIKVLKNLLERLFIKNDTNDPNMRINLYLCSRLQGIEPLEACELGDYLEILGLAPFDKQEVSEYIDSIFGESALSSSLRQAIPAINTRVGGNPFFLQELIRSMINNNILIRTPQYWDLAQSFTDINLPDNLKTLITNRLEGFPMNTEEQKILGIISLLNRIVFWSELNDIKKTDFNFLLRLERTEILQSEIKDGNVGFYLAHDLIQAAITATIDHKEVLHALIASRLEIIHKQNLEAYYEEIAHHYVQADNREKAIFYLDQAGEQAKKRFENMKALAFFETELPLIHLQKRDKIIDVLLNKGLMHWVSGDYPSAAKVYKEAGELAEAINDFSRASQAYWRYSHVLVERDDRECFLIAKKAKHYAEKSDDQIIHSRALNILGCCHMQFSQEYNLAIEYFDQGAKIAEKCKDVYGTIANIGNLATLLYKLGNFNKALGFNTYALKKTPDLPEYQRPKAFGYVVQGKIYHSLGNDESAIEYFDRSIVLSEKIGCVNIYVEARINKGEIFLVSQQYGDAQKMIDRVRNIMDKVHDPLIVSSFKILSAKLDYVSGDRVSGKQQLIDLLNRTQKKQEQASLNYELWCMEKDELYKSAAITLYEELTNQFPDYIYKKHLQSLRENKPVYQFPFTSKPEE